MAKKIKINDLSKEINKILEFYSDEVISDTKEVVDDVTDKALSIVKEKAPVDDRNVKRKGKYKRSLKKTTVFESNTEKRNVIHASGGEHRLAHLLEDGHATVNGGRVDGKPHFKYADDYVNEEFPKKLEEKLGG